MRTLLVVLGVLIAVEARAQLQMAPDGSYTQGPPQLAPDGSYVGGTPTLAPNGQWVGTGSGGRVLLRDRFRESTPPPQSWDSDYRRRYDD